MVADSIRKGYPMYQIQITAQVYSRVERRAIEAGFASVDEYVVDLLTRDVFENAENLDGLFTPERLAHIDRAVEQIEAGQFHTAAQVREHLRNRFEA